MTKKVPFAILRHRHTHVQTKKPVSQRGFIFRVMGGGKASIQDQASVVVELAHPLLDGWGQAREANISTLRFPPTVVAAAL
jgi:hypothetical protein